MNKIVAVIVILLLLGGGYWYWTNQKPEVGSQKPEEQEQAKVEEQNGQNSPPPNLPPQGGGNEEKAGEGVTVQEISMTAGNFFFTPKELTLKKGRPVKITIQNSGGHTFTIDELGVNKKLAEGANVIEFTPESEGVFIYYCATPGHRQAGQYGAVTVEE